MIKTSQKSQTDNLITVPSSNTNGTTLETNGIHQTESANRDAMNGVSRFRANEEFKGSRERTTSCSSCGGYNR